MAEDRNNNSDMEVEDDVISVGVPFALTPAKALTGVIDYTTKEGRYHYAEGTKQLESELFDANPEDLFGFLKALARRARAYGWDDEVTGTLRIPEDPENLNSDTVSLIENYGTILLKTISDFDTLFVFNKS